MGIPSEQLQESPICAEKKSIFFQIFSGCQVFVRKFCVQKENWGYIIYRNARSFVKTSPDDAPEFRVENL